MQIAKAWFDTSAVHWHSLRSLSMLLLLKLKIYLLNSCPVPDRMISSISDFNALGSSDILSPSSDNNKIYLMINSLSFKTLLYKEKISSFR